MTNPETLPPKDTAGQELPGVSGQRSGVRVDPDSALLRAIVRRLGSVCIAYSGGVDSTLLVAVCGQVLPPERVLAVTVRSDLTPREEWERAVSLATTLGARHRVIDVDLLAKAQIAANRPDRCYFCKHTVFSRLRELAAEEGLAHLIHGANVDDLADYRPGTRAAEELGARAPLVEAGFGKAKVRALSRQMELPTWDLPSSACLASRVPYYTPLTSTTLTRIQAAEEAVRALTSVRQLRVRDHFPVARIEMPAGDMPLLGQPAMRERIVAALQAEGYRYVTMDMEGFRSGSLNEVIEQEH